MANLWKGLRLGRKAYEVARLVDARAHSDSDSSFSNLHIVCDIDKTYLETKFESLTSMAKIAFEDADDKVTVPGARDVLLWSRWGSMDEGDSPPNKLHFVSSSPPQLRTVLSEKLSRDGLDWSSDTFKNQAYNIRMGRMDMLRQHIGYKSLAILNVVRNAGSGARFVFIGDNAESDPLIYFGIKKLIDRTFTVDSFQAYLEAIGLDPGMTRDLGEAATDIPQSEVLGILIRRVPEYPMVEIEDITCEINFFENYFVALLVLSALNVTPAGVLTRAMRTFHNRYGFEMKELQDCLVRFKELIPGAVSSKFAPDTTGTQEPYQLAETSPLNAEQIVAKAGAWYQQIHGVN